MNKVFSQLKQVVEQYVHKEEYDTNNNNNNKTRLHIYVDVTNFFYILYLYK